MIYLDANVFVYANLHTGREGEWCREVLRSVASGRLEALTSALTVDEVTYQVREERGLEASLEAGHGILEMAHLSVAPADTEVLWRSLEISEQTKLFPRDAIHAATALMRDASEFYSEDADFEGVEGLRRRWMR